MNKLFVMTIVMLLSLNTYSKEEEHNHDHKKSEKSQSKKHDHDNEDEEEHKEEGHDHGSHEEHEDEDEHAHGHGGGKAIGEGKAIVQVDEKLGFKLSPEAIKTLGLKLQTISESIFNISKKTLVASKDVKGIYRFKDGFFKLLPATIKKETKQGYLIEVAGVGFGDQIVVDGTGLLRVADVYSTDKSEYGHGH